MKILAHRGNVSGPNPPAENSLRAYADAIDRGFGLEIDVRRDSHGDFYIGHDAGALTVDNDLRHFAPLFRKAGSAVIAVNVKELGYEEDLARLVASGVFGDNAFLFDFELLEKPTPGAAQRRVHGLRPGVVAPTAARVSDRGETLTQALSIPSEVIWADEFDRLWITGADIEAIRARGRKVYLISPELHGFDRALRLDRWADFKQWGVDGLCTDFALEAQQFFSSSS